MKIFCNKLHYKYLKKHDKNQSENKISVLKLSVEKYLLKKKECLIKWSSMCKAVFLMYISNFTFWKEKPFSTNRCL